MSHPEADGVSLRYVSHALRLDFTQQRPLVGCASCALKGKEFTRVGFKLAGSKGTLLQPLEDVLNSSSQ